MKFAGPVTAFTTDGVTLEGRNSVTVDRAWPRLDPIRVAKQAIAVDRPVEVIIGAFKTRREIPAALSANTR